MTQNEKEAAIQAQNDIIRDREARLRSKDYIGTKIAMGVAKKSDYAEEIAETEAWRKDINDAQARLAELTGITEFDEPEQNIDI